MSHALPSVDRRFIATSVGTSSGDAATNPMRSDGNSFFVNEFTYSTCLPPSMRSIGRYSPSDSMSLPQSSSRIAIPCRRHSSSTPRSSALVYE